MRIFFCWEDGNLYLSLQQAVVCVRRRLGKKARGGLVYRQEGREGGLRAVGTPGHQPQPIKGNRASLMTAPNLTCSSMKLKDFSHRDPPAFAI